MDEQQEEVVPVPEGCPSETKFQGRASVCDGCPGQAMCQSLSALGSKHDPDQEQMDIRMNAIKHKIMVISGKGGVGKSSMAASIAVGLSERQQKVGILDVDICGPSIPRLLDVENQRIQSTSYGWIPAKAPNHDVVVMSIGSVLPENDAPIIWRGPRKTNMVRRFLKDTFWGKLDYLIIDTPPGTSDEHISTISSLKKANPEGAIIVTTPQELSLQTIRKEITFCKKMKVPILGIVENMSGFICPCCGELTEIFANGKSGVNGGKDLAQQFGIPFLGSVPLDPVKKQSIYDSHTRM